MSWFKSILLLGVLGMTWAECDRRPAVQTRAWPEAAFEAVTTNTNASASSARIVSTDPGEPSCPSPAPLP